MKRFSKVLSVLAAAAMLVLMPGADSLTVQAAEPATYSVKYVTGDVNEWRYMPGSTFDDEGYTYELYRLQTDLKDGDSVVVYGADAPSSAPLDLGTAKLGSLTIFQNASAIVHTGGIKDCYVLAGSYSAINGEVTNAHLYDYVTCTFNDSVLDMTLHYDGDAPTSNLSCGSTVGHFSAVANADGRKYFEFYSINSAKLVISDGSNQTPYNQYSSTPSAEYLQAMGLASAPETPAPEASAPSSGTSDEYDSVPKTGDSFIWLGLLSVSAICFTGTLLLRKKNQ